MAQSKEFVDASHALNDLSHALALLESENASLRGAADGLCDENAKLREELDAAKHDLSLFSERIVELGAENAKLREYAKLMHTHIKVCCDACGECGFCDIDALTRELGIEVDA